MSAALEGTTLHATVAVAALALVAVSASGLWWLRGPLASSATRLVALLGLAVGALTGDALLHLLPHAWAERGPAATLLLTACGFGLFAAIDRLRATSHRHHGQRQASGVMRWTRLRVGVALMMDALHHLLDGVILAVAFVASPVLGAAAWIALLAHELPKEWGELAMLVAAGRTKAQAVRLNLMAAAPLLLGAGLGLAWGDGAHQALGWLGAVVAGGFLYLALFLLWPTLGQLRRGGARTTPVPWRAMAAGAIVMGSLALAERHFGLDHGHVHGLVEPEIKSTRSYAPWLPERSCCPVR